MYGAWQCVVSGRPRFITLTEMCEVMDYLTSDHFAITSIVSVVPKDSPEYKKYGWFKYRPLRIEAPDSLDSIKYVDEGL